MEIRGEFRYDSSRKQQDFVANRFMHSVEGFTPGFDPYTESTGCKIGGLNRPVSIATQVLWEAKRQSSVGTDQHFVTKMQPIYCKNLG